MTMLMLVRAAGLLAGPPLFVGCTAQPAQQLGQLPPVELQVLMSTRNVQSGANATINVLTLDPNTCFKLADSVEATINGHSLPLTDAGGTLSRKGGATYCEPPHFDGANLPLVGDATIQLHDSTAVFSAGAPAALSGVVAMMLQPIDGVMLSGQTVQIGLAPNIGTINHATDAYRPTSDGSLAFSGEYPSSAATLSVSGAGLSFAVPASTPAGAGTLEITATISIPVSSCLGPAACTVQMGMGSVLTASVGGP